MITEYARVIEIEPNRVRVEIRSSSGCSDCSAKSGCGNGVLDRWLNPDRKIWINSDHDRSIAIGDEIKLGVEEGAFVRNALSLYLVPIMIFLLGTGLGYQLSGEIASILGGIFGLALGTSVVRFLLNRCTYAAGFSPRIVD